MPPIDESSPQFAGRIRLLSRLPPALLRALLGVVVVGAAAGVWMGAGRAALQSARTGCLTNERRLSTALLLYAQDYDARIPPIAYRRPDGAWRTWFSLLSHYTAGQDIAVCPTYSGEPDTRDVYSGYAFPSTYALNMRFSDVFGKGAFPIENIELPAQTVLLAEAGPLRSDGPYGPPVHSVCMSYYWDTAWWPEAYPSPHSRRMNVSAADGHAVNVKVEHYKKEDHDPLYGRLGGAIFNWNGGYPNGDTNGPPLE